MAATLKSIDYNLAMTFILNNNNNNNNNNNLTDSSQACLSDSILGPHILQSGMFIWQRVMYKLCTIVHKCLHAAAPPYLSELCIPVSTSARRHFLRSATYGDLLVPRTSTSTYGPRRLAVSGPSVWNKLPATLHVSPTLGQFQSKLKAVLFRSDYET